MTPVDRTAVLAGTAFPDVTYAFTAAQAANKHLWARPGGYGLVNLRVLNGRTLLFAGKENCFLKQLDATQPAINCLSDETVGQLKGVRIEGFSMIGTDVFTDRSTGSSPVSVTGAAAAFRVAAYGAYAVWDSAFSFYSRNTWNALEVQGQDAANVFNCTFHVTSEGTRSTALLLNGGVYNVIRAFVTQCDWYAVENKQSSSELLIVGENCQFHAGQCNVLRVEVEGIASTSYPATLVIEDQGFYNVYIKPVCNLLPQDSGRMGFAFKGFYGTTYITPQILQEKPIWPLSPSYGPISIVGGVRGVCPGKIEGNHDYYHQRMISTQGDMLDWSMRRRGDLVTQYFSPTTTFNAIVNVLTDVVIWNNSVTIAAANVSFVEFVLPYDGIGTTQTATFQDGMQFTFVTTASISTINWPTGGEFANLPTTLAANTALRIVYSADAAKFFIR